MSKILKMEFQSWEGAAESSCKREETRRDFHSQREQGVQWEQQWREITTQNDTNPQLESALEFFWRELSWPLRADGRIELTFLVLNVFFKRIFWFTFSSTLTSPSYLPVFFSFLIYFSVLNFRTVTAQKNIKNSGYFRFSKV
jgi:hypothetical protein